MSRLRVRILDGFDDPSCPPEVWDRLLRQSQTDVMFLTPQWMRAWWETMGRGGRLLLVAVERDGQIVTLAPLFELEGIVFFLGAGESDYLDFLGENTDPDILTAILETARDAAPGLFGFRFHLIPRRSATVQSLPEAARRIAPIVYLDKEVPAFDVDMVANRQFMQTTTTRSMFKRETWFREHGRFEVREFRDAESVLPHLDEFFAQHQARWAGKDYVSPFAGEGHRRWLRRVCELSASFGWLRVHRLDWNDQLLSIGFAWHWRGIHYCGPWSFNLEHGKHCPGHVLLRHCVLCALADDLHTYDLRGGDDHYKGRFPARISSTQSWFVYFSGG